MERIKVAVDIDGILADFCYQFCNKVNEIYGIKKIYHNYDAPHWDLYKWYDELEKVHIDKVLEEIYKDNHFWETIPVLQINNSGIELLKYIIKFREDIHITFLSSRDGIDVLLQTCKWLSRVLGENTSNYNVVITNEKIDYIKNNKIKYFIDDKLQTALEASEHCIVFKPKYLYNQISKDDSYVLGRLREGNLEEFLLYVLDEVGMKFSDIYWFFEYYRNKK